MASTVATKLSEIATGPLRALLRHGMAADVMVLVPCDVRTKDGVDMEASLSVHVFEDKLVCRIREHVSDPLASLTDVVALKNPSDQPSYEVVFPSPNMGHQLWLWHYASIVVTTTRSYQKRYMEDHVRQWFFHHTVRE